VEEFYIVLFVAKQIETNIKQIASVKVGWLKNGAC
jgi:hypothetical protein